MKLNLNPQTNRAIHRLLVLQTAKRVYPNVYCVIFKNFLQLDASKIILMHVCSHLPSICAIQTHDECIQTMSFHINTVLIDQNIDSVGTSHRNISKMP